MMRALYMLWQVAWGLPQAFLGAVVFLATRPQHVGTFKGAVVSVWSRKSSVSLGPFVFVSESFLRPGNDSQAVQTAAFRRLVAHEYGHTIQSLVLGPLYLPVVGIPSALWANLPACQRRRAIRGVSYYRFYTERNANWLSRRILHLDVPK